MSAFNYLLQHVNSLSSEFASANSPSLSNFDDGPSMKSMPRSEAEATPAPPVQKPAAFVTLEDETPITNSEKNNYSQPIAKKQQNRKSEKPEDADGPPKKRQRRVIPDVKEYIPEKWPKSLDVVSGRGGRANNHPGNKAYWQVILEARAGYQDAESDIEKNKIAYDIMESIHMKDGRFLQREAKSERGKMPLWFILPERVVLDKIKQALRDKYVPLFARDDSEDGKNGAENADAPKKTAEDKNKRAKDPRNNPNSATEVDKNMKSSDPETENKKKPSEEKAVALEQLAALSTLTLPSFQNLPSLSSFHMLSTSSPLNSLNSLSSLPAGGYNPSLFSSGYMSRSSMDSLFDRRLPSATNFSILGNSTPNTLPPTGGATDWHGEFAQAVQPPPYGNTNNPWRSGRDDDGSMRAPPKIITNENNTTTLPASGGAQTTDFRGDYERASDDSMRGPPPSNNEKNNSTTDPPASGASKTDWRAEYVRALEGTPPPPPAPATN